MATSLVKNSSGMNPAKVIGIQFSILSADEIRKTSVAHITSKDTYVNNKPVIGGLFDPRMGVIEPGLICPTDGYDYIQTPGYFGHIELARPVFFIQYFNQVIKILRCVCFKCSKILINKEEHQHALELKPKERWDYVFSRASRVHRCGDENPEGCGCRQPDKIAKEGIATIMASWASLETEEGGAATAAAIASSGVGLETDGEGSAVGAGAGATASTDEDGLLTMKITPEIALRILRRISDDDITFLGFSPVWSRPDSMICQVLPVPPPAVRPSVKHDAQQRSEDDITHIIVNILKANTTLRDKILQNADEKVIEDWTSVLQYFVATMVNNSIPGAAPVTQRSGRAFKSISERLNGKGGRVRGNLMGKRVDFSARSVITPDANLSIRELGVPLKIAMNMTFPVKVNTRTRSFLLKLVQNGPDVFPGAKVLERATGESISLKYVDRMTLRLNDGDIVHRHLMDGDAVLFNRQPTLHRMSMMCHIVRVMREGNTFRMNVGDTKPYNADFDGDEMNMHAPQDDESSAELRYLAAVPYQIISPAHSTPIIGIFQDSLLGSYRFTRPVIDFDTRKAMNLMMNYPRLDMKLFADPERRVSNFELLTQILPPLSVVQKNGLFDGESEDAHRSNNVMEIIAGKMLRGHLEKGMLGGGKGLIHRIFNDYGHRAASDFIDALQDIITEYMKASSFSVGVSDLVADRKTKEEIIKAITDKKQRVYDILDQVRIGAFENNSGKSNAEMMETKINSLLDKARDDAGKIGRKSLSQENRFVVMVNSGSKGGTTNIAQMISCLGQQNVDGRRIPYGFEHRTLPHYAKFDDSPEARGFVESSFIRGLNPQELFFHAMGGRVGLIDTAVKTSQTGYIQRRLIKGMEDLKVEYDMTVRDAMRRVVQFSYGDDGVDTTKIESIGLPLIKMTIEQIYAHFHMPEDDATGAVFSTSYTAEALSRVKAQRDDLMRKTKQYIEDTITARDTIVANVLEGRDETSVRIPINFQRLIFNIKNQVGITASSMVDISPLDAFTMIEQTFAELETMRSQPPSELLRAAYFFYLSPKELLMTNRFNRAALVMLLAAIVVAYKKAIVAPGEMVGMIAAQSIGEPTTQMTLNSITYDSEIIVRDAHGHVFPRKIGEFTEEIISKVNASIEAGGDPKQLEYYSDKDTTLAYVPADMPLETWSVDKKGNMVWTKLEAVTQHPVINKDGTNTLVRVKTRHGREITATKAKSFLMLVDGEISEMDGDHLRPGMYIPVARKAMEHSERRILNVKNEGILSPHEYLFMSEARKAESVMGERHWWLRHSGATFILPYSRSDSFRDALFGGVRNNAKSKQAYLDGAVYPKKATRCKATIPENIPLDYDFGYLIGAYCAEGCVTRTQISIANNEDAYMTPILRLCDKWNITHKRYLTKDKGKEGWMSGDLRIYSIVLRDILANMCGIGSANKRVPPQIVFSNDSAKQGFLDGYIGGDGQIHKKGVQISVCSVSKNMLIDVQVLLNTIGIYSAVKTPTRITKNNRGSKNILQHYLLLVNNQQAINLAKRLTMPTKKQEQAVWLANKTSKFEICSFDVVPDMCGDTLSITKTGRRNECYADLFFDEIVTVEEVPCPTPYVYDLTVAETRNFSLYNQCQLVDTFHLAGVASKSNVTRGVPRIEELLSLSENPKNPSITVFMKPEMENDKQKTQQMLHVLEHTKLRDVVKSVSICFDPDDLETLIDEDRPLMAQYREFEMMMRESAGMTDESADEFVRSKWIVRFVMDKEQMLERNITMDDIHFAIKNGYKDYTECVFSDYNADKLVFRLRLMDVLSNKKKGLAVSKQAPLDQSDEIYMIQNIQENLLDGIILKGVRGIRGVVMRKQKGMLARKNGAYVESESWVLDTIGTNLLDILGMPGLDNTRTYSNDIIETFAVLGIEATRQMIYNEIAEVMEHGGAFIDYHHLGLLCDRMCMTRRLVSIFRHGINNDDIGPIAKASFEETPEMFLRAARHAELDPMRGVSANVMCGQRGNFGTSSFGLVLDVEAMSRFGNKKLDEEVDIEKMFVFESADDPCSSERIQNTVGADLIRAEDMGDDDDDYDPGF